MKNQKKILQRSLNKPYIYVHFKDVWHVLVGKTDDIGISKMVRAFAPGFEREHIISKPIKTPSGKNYMESTNILAYLEKSTESGSLNLITRTAAVTIRIPDGFPKNLIDIRIQHEVYERI